MSDPITIAQYDALIREVLASGGEFRIYPHGTSMLPLLRQGRDSVALRQLDRPVQKHDILFYQRPDGSYVLHRVKAVTPHGLVLWGDHQHVPEYGVEESQVIGYAARIFRDDNEVDCQRITYRLYVAFWQFIAVRKVLLPIAYHLRKEKQKC